jgi:catechol 2,3-dioxygenase
LAAVLRRVLTAGTTLDGAADQGASEAIYLHDPDQNAVELYVDREEGHWPRDQGGNIALNNTPFDLQALLDTYPAQGVSQN